MKLAGLRNRDLWAVLLFKWPPYLVYSLAFPVVTSWVPHVQLVSLLILETSSVHAMAVFGKELVTSPAILQACGAVDAALTRPMHMGAARRGSGTAYGLPSGVAEMGPAASCRSYIFGMWLMCLSAVFWSVLFWHARCERKEREEYLHSLGFRGSLTWPLLRVMVVRVLGVQLLVTLFFVVFLEDLVGATWSY